MYVCVVFLAVKDFRTSRLWVVVTIKTEIQKKDDTNKPSDFFLWTRKSDVLINFLLCLLLFVCMEYGRFKMPKLKQRNNNVSKLNEKPF